MLTRKMKPLEVELAEEVQQALLSLPASGEFTSVGAMVARSAELLELANKTLADNALVQLTAHQLMKAEKRRGVPAIVAHIDGTVVLQVAYSETETVVEDLPTNGKLPTLDQLREQAQKLSVDVSDLGRQKLKILERLTEHRRTVSSPNPPSLSDETARTPFVRVTLPSSVR